MRKNTEPKRSFPEVVDPRWEEWSKPVLTFLALPRDWRALNKWCRQTKFGPTKLRHCLAWLEENQLIFARGKTWTQITQELTSDAPLN